MSDHAHAGAAERVREDLLQDSELLRRLGELVSVSGPASNVVIAAPHHAVGGTPLGSGHDENTGPIAVELARQLGARCVVATELRAVVDVNKNPWTPDVPDFPGPAGTAQRKVERLMKLFYQSQLFVGAPDVVVEIHGFERADAPDFEVSCGFPLAADIERDALLLDALRAFKFRLEDAVRENAVLEGRGQPVVVYPLDADVRLRATGTHTFNRIERLRELGLNTGGLHVELRRRLRPDPGDGGRTHAAVAEVLARAVGDFREALEGHAGFDLKGRLVERFTQPSVFKPFAQVPFVVQRAPREAVGKDVALMAARDMTELDIEAGQSIALSPGAQGGEVLVLRVGIGTCPTGVVLLDRRLRARLGVDLGDRVRLGYVSGPDRDAGHLGFVARIEEAEQSVVWIPRASSPPAEASGGSRSAVLWAGRGTSEAVSVKCGESSEIGGCEIALSLDVARKAGVTYGDVVSLQFEDSVRHVQIDESKFE